MASSDAVVRRARQEDATAAVPLLYLTAADMYRLMTGSEERAVHVIRRAFLGAGTDTSREVCWVAELDGRVVGVMAAFPGAEQARRGRRILRRMLLGSHPRLWPATLRLHRAGSRLPDPPHRRDAFYVDALSTAPDARRRGVASALLDAAAAEARRRGHDWLHLDTTKSNEGARALYERYGFVLQHELPAAHGIPAQVAYELPLR